MNHSNNRYSFSLPDAMISFKDLSDIDNEQTKQLLDKRLKGWLLNLYNLAILDSISQNFGNEMAEHARITFENETCEQNAMKSAKKSSCQERNEGA